ncbi:CDP-diacylglycerol diphosphatase [Acetobacter estunensis]|uniref:CDP-diacylglycerol diphosphatase n=1 Tax=Acetobacter estunensis TaxID=104097 RepID=UPI001C2D3AC3|nr:CDP-diacylglycerol diphosphatase [Acetobacter estunensis]MBV1838496.1 CDP-diacylglycerol diphosphatase [Acetobacter estunensis]
MTQWASHIARRIPGLFLTGSCLVGLSFAQPVRAANPDALWHIVHERCASQDIAHGPGACAVLDSPHRVAVLKSIEGRSQYLLIPTDRNAGMESPALRDPATPDYFAHAWAQAFRVGEGYGVRLPREDVALAINSQDGRSQNQFHIHVECIRPEIKVALYYMREAVSSQWAFLPALLRGHPYRAMRVNGTNLAGVKPFLRLAQSLRYPESEMGHHTLAVVPEIFDDNQPGFLILDGVADLAHKNRGSAEELQDHSCAIVALDPLVRPIGKPSSQ